MIKLALGIKAGSDGEVSDGGNGVDSTGRMRKSLMLGKKAE